MGHGEATVCQPCARAGRPSVVGPDGRHFAGERCYHGIRDSRACHHPVRDAFVRCARAALSAGRVIAEMPGDQRAMREFMATHGQTLDHQPDAVLVDFDGPGSWTLIDVKTQDTGGATHIGTHHTDSRRRSAHRAIEQSTPAIYGRPLPARMRVVTVAVSTFGALGAQAEALIRGLARRTDGSVPPTLLDEASWATPRFAPFMRMALTVAARRGMAVQLSRRWQPEGGRRVPADDDSDTDTE